MANPTLESATVLPDGRVVQLVFAASPVPASHALPDWRAGYAAGARVTLSTGAPLEFIGAWSTRSDLGPPFTIDTPATTGGNLPTGTYRIACTLARVSDGVEEKVSPVGYYVVAKAGRKIPISGLGGARVPAGYVANVYLSLPGGDEDSLVLYRGGIPAGTGRLDLADPTWADPTRRFPGFTTLRWTVAYLIADPDRVVTYGDPGPTVTAGAGLLADRFGNATAAFDAAPATNLSLVQADRFTSRAIPRGEGGVALHVSSSRGAETGVNTTDYAAGQDPATPLQTVTRALALLQSQGQHGKGAALRLLQGDTFTLPAPRPIRVGGQDARHPFIIEDYWHDFGGAGLPAPGVRPVIRGDTVTLLTTNGGGGSPWPLSNVLIRRIHFEQTNAATSSGSAAFSLLQDGSDWTIDDCLIERFSTGIVAQATVGTFGRFTLLRTIVRDCFDAGSAHSQGAFFSGVDDLLISQCCFDTNGRKSADLTRGDIYSHNLYLQLNTRTPVLWGNAIGRGGSHGVQMRGGGVAARNVFPGNATACFLSGSGGWFSRNVVAGACDIVQADGSVLPRGTGLDLGTGLAGYGQGARAVGVGVESNLFAGTVGTDPVWLGVDLDPKAPLENLLCRNNTIRDAGRRKLKGVPPDPATGVEHRHERNIFAAGQGLLFQDMDAPVGRGWLVSDANVLDSGLAADSWCRSANANHGLAAWKDRTGTEAGSLVRAPAFAGPAPGVPDATAMRDRPPGVWEAAHDPSLMWEAHAAACRPTNLPALGTGPWDYYGASDYRETIPTPEPPTPPEPEPPIPEPSPEPRPMPTTPMVDVQKRAPAGGWTTVRSGVPATITPDPAGPRWERARGDDVLIMRYTVDIGAMIPLDRKNRLAFADAMGDRHALDVLAAVDFEAGRRVYCEETIA